MALSGRIPVRDIAVGKPGGSYDGLIGDLDLVMRLVLWTEAFDDVDGLIEARRLHVDRLEPALERAVLFDVLPELIERGGADALDLAARQGGLEHARRVDGAFCGSCADQRMQLVDEENDVVRLDDLLHDDLEPFLELAAVLGARDQGAEVERYDTTVQDVLRNVGVDDALRKAFDDRGLADAGLADDDRDCSWSCGKGSGARGRSPCRVR